MTPTAKRALAAGTINRVQAAKVQALAARGRVGVKLLDITEQPLSQELGSKRRRKLVGVPVNAPGDGAKDEKMDEDNADAPDHPEPAKAGDATPSSNFWTLFSIYMIDSL